MSGTIIIAAMFLAGGGSIGLIENAILVVQYLIAVLAWADSHDNRTKKDKMPATHALRTEALG